MVNVRLFAAYLIQNLVLEQGAGSKHLKVLKRNLRTELLQLMSGERVGLA